MIGYIKGRIIGKNEQSLLLENNGIGYKVFTTPQVLTREIGEEIELYTHLQVREDALTLYGFANASELSFFELLTTVSGVGPKMALSVLSAGDLELIKGAIVSQDAAVFTKVGGVGKKTAERIIVELKEKISGSVSLQGFGKSDDLLSALEQLGYSLREIKEALKGIDHSLSTEEKLKQALKLLSK